MSRTACEQADTLILGAGVCGLAAASVLGKRAVVVEQESRPGGLVRTDCFDGYWFDRVIHLLYFADEDTAERIHALLGADLAPCHPEAFVECLDGTAPFPFQVHLGALGAEAAERCVRDFVEAQETDDGSPPTHYEEMLRRSFGKAMCESFFFPYNRKMWKRALNGLAPSGFHWNIRRPSLDDVRRGASNPTHRAAAYNSNGWYPRPPADAPLRGMELLSARLAQRVPDLRLRQRVVAWDPEGQSFEVQADGGSHWISFERACLSTLPLPALLSMTPDLPETLRRGLDLLRWNRVLSIAVCVEGPRPQGRGHWRYYADEDLCFTRLIYLHEFDPGCAPPEGFPLLVEIPVRAEDPPPEDGPLFARVRTDLDAAQALPDGASIRSIHRMEANPAYVVFTPENQSLMEEAREFVLDKGVTPLGRYGRWEYSSMAGVMRDGFRWAVAQLGGQAG